MFLRFKIQKCCWPDQKDGTKPKLKGGHRCENEATLQKLIEEDAKWNFPAWDRTWVGGKNLAHCEGTREWYKTAMKEIRTGKEQTKEWGETQLPLVTAASWTQYSATQTSRRRDSQQIAGLWHLNKVNIFALLDTVNLHFSTLAGKGPSPRPWSTSDKCWHL